MSEDKRTTRRRGGSKGAPPPEHADERSASVDAQVIGSDSESGESPASQPISQAVCPVVGLGASAGGLPAFQSFFAHTPPDGGLAFVLVQHFSPEHKSSLQELLGRCTKMVVTEIADGTPVEPNHVYVLPAKAVLRIESGLLRLSEPRPLRGDRTPIDVFFRSLAEDQGENAACVVLSGAGSDGSSGLKAIKEHGGLAMAQAGESAQYDGMLRSAIATGLVDFVLPVEEMPGKLIEYFRHALDFGRRKGSDGLHHETRDHLDRIAALLAARTGHDFGQYKEGTIARRIQRRMQVRQVGSVPDYLRLLSEEPGEIDLLFQDLLIGVTHFFRDPEAFRALQATVIPKLFENRPPNDSTRVWVPGCASGEEAYSIAILLREELARLGTQHKVQIFASDIDEAALETARTGRYPAAIADAVPEKRLKRYFLKEDGTYRVVDELREMCIFSPHNMLRDPPFSKLDLISCRNLMIYLKGELQNKLFPLFHYALKPEAYLFLGPAENVTQHGKLFVALDKPHRIFRRRDHAAEPMPHFPIVPIAGRDRSIPGTPVPRHITPATAAVTGTVERMILDRYAPSYVIINAHQEVVRFSGRTGKYLDPPAGEPNSNILMLTRPGLRMDLRAALHKAIRDGRSVVQKNIGIQINGGRQMIDLIVQPLPQEQGTESLYAVIFRDLGPVKPEPGEEAEAVPDVEHANLQQLEAELRHTREQLQTTTEELESANEELKSSNEELLSMNEELQSINEELQTVNAELSSRVDELAQANNDLKNLLENTRIVTLFLDNDLRIRNVTPAIADLFHIVEGDAGRPITDIKPRFSYPALEEDLKKVRRTLSGVEKEIEIGASDTVFMMRILPYRTTSGAINGLVLTFVDVTRLKKAEADARESHRRLNEILESTSEGFYALDAQWRFTYANRTVAEILGTPQQDLIGKEIWETLPDAGGRFQAEHYRVAKERRPAHFEVVSPRSERWLEVNIAPSDSGLAVNFRDIDERKRSRDRQQVLLAELDHRVKNTLALCASIASQTLRTARSPGAFVGAFQRRIQALAQAHTLLTRNRWNRVPLRALIEAELAPFREDAKDQVTLDGPEILLRPNATISLGMALHELTTNAVKYGALSTLKGRVEITWSSIRTGAEQDLRLRWVESGGPPVVAPESDGFGRRLLEKSLTYELGGTAVLEFRSEGMQCVMEFPLKDKAGRPSIGEMKNE